MRDDGLFAQEQWTHKRLTLQGAVRFDRAVELGAAAAGGPGPLPAAADLFPETPIVDSFKDLTPRVAAAYDLFGTGKTAIKTTFGKYLEAAFTGRAYASGNPTSRIIQSVNRAWTDANSNFGDRLRSPERGTRRTCAPAAAISAARSRTATSARPPSATRSTRAS